MSDNHVYNVFGLLYREKYPIQDDSLDDTMDSKRASRKLKEAIFSELENGCSNTLEKFVKVGGSLDVRNEYGQTPLIVATLNYDIVMVRKLLELGADPHVTDNTHMEALFHATVAGDPEMVEVLLDATQRYDERKSNVAHAR